MGIRVSNEQSKVVQKHMSFQSMPVCRPYYKVIGTALLLPILIAVLTSCAFAGGTTAKQAAALVTNWLNLDSSPLGASLGHTVASTHSYTDAEEKLAYFIVNLKPSGFVIVSADDLVEPIVGFAEDGTYDPSPLNPLGALVSNDLPKRVAAARSVVTQGAPTTTGAANEAQAKWLSLLIPAPAEQGIVQGVSSLSDPRVDPFVMSHWGQGNVCGSACYNYYTPPNAAGDINNYPAGCVALAAAQLMRFHQWPTTPVGNAFFDIQICGMTESRALRGGDGGGGAYAWSEMVLNPGCSMTETQRRAIGALCHDAGVAARMNYCDTGSGTLMLYESTALRSTFHYSNVKYADSYWNISTDKLYTMINPNLHARYPVLLGILREDGGHAVVCDGYGYNASTVYHHLNMGWEGTDDAWYNLPNIDAPTHTYSAVSGCLYNVYTSGTGEIIGGRVTNAAGNPISEATVKAGTYTATTDLRGFYAVVKVPSNTGFPMSVSAPGYLFVPRTVTTSSSQDWGSRTGNLRDIDFAGQAASNLATAKTAADGIVVGCQGLTIMAVFGDYFYAEKEDRSSGILVHKTGHGLLVGGGADIIGALSTDSLGERFIEASSVVPATGHTIRPPLVMNKQLGGGDWHFVQGGTGGQRGVKDGFGLNNIGLLVKTAGAVKYIDPSGAFAYVDDGGALNDGNALGPMGAAVSGARVILPATVTVPQPPAMITVTGISSMWTVGTSSVRCLKARSQSDIAPAGP